MDTAAGPAAMEPPGAALVWNRDGAPPYGFLPEAAAEHTIRPVPFRRHFGPTSIVMESG